MDYKKVKKVSIAMFLMAVAVVCIMNYVGVEHQLYMPMGVVVILLLIGGLLLKYKYYRCPYCRNLFYFKEKTPKICPYCGKELN